MAELYLSLCLFLRRMLYTKKWTIKVCHKKTKNKKMTLKYLLQGPDPDASREPEAVQDRDAAAGHFLHPPPGRHPAGRPSAPPSPPQLRPCPAGRSQGGRPCLHILSQVRQNTPFIYFSLLQFLKLIYCMQIFRFKEVFLANQTFYRFC
jgi:hypothetical protein